MTTRNDFDRLTHARILVYMPFIEWEGASQDALFQTQAAWLRNEVGKYAAAVGADNEFRYLDYADSVQNPLVSYGEANVRKMQEAAKRWDPEGVMQRLVPGVLRLVG